MRNIIILVAASLLFGATSCALLDDKPPHFPDDVNKIYVFDITQFPDTDEMLFNCIEFTIKSKHPFLLDEENPRVVEMENCHHVSGYKPDDSVKFYNYVDDSNSWMKKKEGQSCTP